MINLTLEECKKFQISPIDYDKEEVRVRDTNINMLYDLLAIISDCDCLEILEDKNNKFNVSELPYKFISFYEKYVGEIDESVRPQNILSKIRTEYKDLIIKIVNFADRWSYEEEFVKNELLNDNDMFLLTFAKDPGKQTFHQRHAAKWLQVIPFVENFQELPSGGKGAYYILKGSIIKGGIKKLKTDEIIPKSIDFGWEYRFKEKKLQFYATHKHTKISGGSQDNQYRDVQEFHMQAKECNDKNCCLLSITDGAYYLLNDTSVSENISKIEYLNSNLLKGERNFATNINMFAKDLIPYIIQWLELNFSNSEIQEEVQKLNILKLSCSFC